MKNKFIKFIAVIIVAAFAIQGLAWGDTKGEGVSTGVDNDPTPLSPGQSLRPLAAGETGKRAPDRMVPNGDTGNPLISPADYPAWVAQSMEKAQVHLLEVRKIGRKMISTMQQIGFDPPSHMESADRVVAQWRRLRSDGASLDELNKFKTMLNGVGREFFDVSTAWNRAVHDRSIYQRLKLVLATVPGKVRRAKRVVETSHNLSALGIDFQNAYDKALKYVNGLGLYFVVDPYNSGSEFQRMFRKEDLGKIEKRLRRDGFEPAKARDLLIHPLSARAQKVLRRASDGEILIGADICEAMARDLARHFYTELSRRFFSVEDDRARVVQIRQQVLGATGAQRESLFVELIDIVDRGYMADDASLIEVRRAAQDVLFAHFDEIGALPEVLVLMKERVMEWMENETQFTRWDSLLRLFGDLANQEEDLTRLRKLYQINRDFNISLQIIAIYTQVMTNIRVGAQSEDAVANGGLQNALAQIDALISLRHDPIIADYLGAFRQYVINHWAHWDATKTFRYLQAHLKDGPMTFIHAMLWRASVERENLWLIRSNENERIASEKLRTYLTDIIHKMNQARNEATRRISCSILRPMAAGEGKPLLKFTVPAEADKEKAERTAISLANDFNEQLQDLGWDLEGTALEIGGVVLVGNDVTIPLYEAMINMMRHAGGGEVEVYYTKGPGGYEKLQIIVIDKGRGIADPDTWLQNSKSIHSAARYVLPGWLAPDDGYGARNIAIFPMGLTLETLGDKYIKAGGYYNYETDTEDDEILIEQGLKFRHAGPSPIKTGTKLTMEWIRPADPGIELALRTQARNNGIFNMAKKKKKLGKTGEQMYGKKSGEWRAYDSDGRELGPEAANTLEENRDLVWDFFVSYERMARTEGGKIEEAMMRSPVSVENLRRQLSTSLGYPFSMEAFVDAIAYHFGPVHIMEASTMSSAGAVKKPKRKNSIVVGDLFAGEAKEKKRGYRKSKEEDDESFESDGLAVVRTCKRYADSIRNQYKKAVTNALLYLLQGDLKEESRKLATRAIAECLRSDIEEPRKVATRIVKEAIEEYSRAKSLPLGYFLDYLKDDEEEELEVSI